jgi:molybdopterin-containing oxidoreductase family iron-sulfur binding subunit
MLMNLNGMSGDYYDYLRASSSSIIVGATWNKIVHDGVYVGASQALSAGSVDYSAAAVHYLDLKAAAGFELVLYTKTGMGDGQQANNPWLQEFPDPITRVIM